MFGKTASVCMAAAAFGLVCSAASAQRMYGVSWAEGSVYSIDLTSGAASLIGNPGVGGLNSAAAVPGADRLYATSTASVLYEIDVATGTVAATHNLDTGAIPGYTIRGLAVDPAGRIYAIADTVPFGTIDTLVTINLTTLDYTVIGSMGENSMQGLAFDDAGNLFALDIDNGGQLFSVNTATGGTTLIGGGTYGSDQQSLEFCQGRLYGGRVNLISIDTTTGNPSVIGPFVATEDMRGLACVGEAPCYPDCTGEGTLDIFDFLCFQDDFVAGGSYACNCNGDPQCDIFDFLCFQDAFVQGCP